MMGLFSNFLLLTLFALGMLATIRSLNQLEMSSIIVQTWQCCKDLITRDHHKFFPCCLFFDISVGAAHSIGTSIYRSIFTAAFAETSRNSWKSTLWIVQSIEPILHPTLDYRNNSQVSSCFDLASHKHGTLTLLY